MRRGDVVRTREEFYALPAGSVVVNVEGLSWARSGPGVMDDEWPREPFPALVRVVGSVQPEWLEAAARAGRTADIAPNDDDWDRISEPHKGDYRKMARAAVAAADKARGIVNSREEFDALPAGIWVKGFGRNGGWQAQVGDMRFVPDEFPGLVWIKP